MRPALRKNAPRAASPPATGPAEPASGKLTQQQLESHLWKAAGILRGKIDSSDYKHYIFGLLFFKRLCDVWQEEYEDRLARYQNEALAAHPDEHRFHIPPGAFWADVRESSTNLGERLNGAFHSIEDANLKLRGVFQDVDFNQKERFPDATLELLLRHFETHRLRRADVDGDVLGCAYEYLIAKFADDAGKKGGEFFTPKQVVRLIVECLDPREGMSIYDPTMGSGGMLLEAAHQLERQGKNPRSLHLFGQEMNLNTWAIGQINLFLHDIDDANIARGDTLRDPKHLTAARTLQTFDRVLANPPFSLKNWGHDVWQNGDPFGRDVFGCPPASYGDLAFVQHMVASLKPQGRAGVVLPHGILFRGGAEGRIRRGLLEADHIEAVIGLAPNLFYGTGIPAAIVLLARGKPAARRGQVLLVDGARLFREGKNQNHLEDEHVAHLVAAFRRFETQPGFARVVSNAEILTKNDGNLNLARYVESIEKPPEIDVATELAEWKRLQERRNEAERRMLGFLEELGYES